MFAINLKLNEKGQKICKKKVEILNYESNTKPTAEQVHQLIADEFMPELVEEILSINESLENVLHSGDIVKVYETPNKFYFAKVEKVVVSKNVKNGFIHVYKIDDYYQMILRFDIFGYEIGGSRKFKKYIEIPSEEEKKHIIESFNKENIYFDIIKMLGADTYPMECPYSLKLETLTKIQEILKQEVYL